MIVEVKSGYYFQKEKEVVKTKAVCASKDYNFQIVIYRNRKSKEKVYVGDVRGLMTL